MKFKNTRLKEGLKLGLLAILCLIIGALLTPVAMIDGLLDTPHRIGAGIGAACGFIIGILLLVSACRAVRADRAELQGMHEQNLKNDFLNWTYLPKFFREPFFKETEEATIPDLAVVLRQARDEIARLGGLPIKNRKRMDRLSETAGEIESAIARKLLDQEALYVLEDRRTKSAVLQTRDYDDCIMVSYNPLLKSEYRLQILKKDIQRYLYVAFALRGARGMIVHGAGIAAEKFIPKVDYSKVDEVARPVENPDLVRAFTKLTLLERPLTSHEKSEKDAERIEEVLTEIRSLIKTARFLVPVKKPETKPEPADVKEVENAAETKEEPSSEDVASAGEGTGKNAQVVRVRLEKGTKISIPMLVSSADETRTAMPLFSDWFEFSRVYPRDGYEGWIWKGEDLSAAGENIFVLNPGSICLELSKERVHSLLEETEEAGEKV